MNKKNIYKVLALAGCVVWLTGCSKDFLDKKPTGEYTADTFYSSDEAVRKGTEPLYNKAWFDFNRRAIVGMGSYRANDAWNPYVSAEFARFQVTSLTEDMGYAWSSLYNVVTLSNATLQNLLEKTTSSVTESVKNAAIGECYLMRGWAYFYLLRGWGANILFEDNQTMIDNPVRPLNTEADVLKFIVRDFRRAAEYLPLNGTDNHPSKYAAKAALAKALLAQSGWDSSSKGDHNRDENILKEVVTLCDEVINSGNYSLMPNYEDLFKAQNNDNSETILAMRWADANLGTSNGWGYINCLYSDLAFPEVTDVNVWGGSLIASVDMIDIYNEDPADTIRRDATFFTPGEYYSYIKAADGGYTYAHNWMQCKKGVLGTKADAGGHLEQMASPLNTYIQRLADVYLIKAEAILGNNDQTSDGQALAAFNAVRQRAGVAPYTKITFEDILRERRIEFCMEYFNWWDMATYYRWKPQTMLDYFNNQQHRAWEMREGCVLKNANSKLSYRAIFPGTNNWYLFTDEGYVLWNDCLRAGENDNTIIRSITQEEYESIRATLLAAKGSDYQPIKLDASNVFMPYPANDIIQNHYLTETPQAYDFGEE